jgi:predicted ATPase
MLIEGLRVDGDWDGGTWPFSVPAIAQIAAHGLTLSPVNVLVGENGSGKSTLIEAVAEAYGIDVRGGHGARQYATTEARSALGERLRLIRTPLGSKATGRNATGFFLRAETAAGMLAFMTDSGVQGYGDRSSRSVSHGESYLSAILGRFDGPGLFLLDEAEGPLSFTSTLALMFRLMDLCKRPDTQILYATHSPLIAALPGAALFELSDSGIDRVDWRDLRNVHDWRSFLERPDRFLHDED